METTHETVSNNETQDNAGQQAETLDFYFRRLDQIKDAIDQEEKVYEATLKELAEDVGKTFCYEGQWYQVAKRFNKPRGREVPFLKKLPGPPKSWLTGMPKGGWPRNDDEEEETQQTNGSSESNGMNGHSHGDDFGQSQVTAQAEGTESEVVLD